MTRNLNLRYILIGLTLLCTNLISQSVLAEASCNSSNPKNCSDKQICYKATGTKGQVRVYRTKKSKEVYFALAEVEKRSLDCKVNQNYRNLHKAASTGLLRSKVSYIQRCKVSANLIKKAQRSLKKLGLYEKKIDGLAGEGTLNAMKEARGLLGTKGSNDECITAQEVYDLEQLASLFKSNQSASDILEVFLDATQSKDRSAETDEEYDILASEYALLSKQILNLKIENQQLTDAYQEVESQLIKSQKSSDALQKRLRTSEGKQFKAGEKISQLEAKIRDLNRRLEKSDAEAKEKNVVENPKETLEDTAEQQHESKLKVFSLSVSHSENYQFDPYFCGFKIVFNPNPIRSKQEEFFFYFNPENNLYLANLSEEISSEIGNSSETHLRNVIFKTQSESLCDPVAPVQDTTFKRTNDGTLYLPNIELISINDPQKEGPNLREQLGIEDERSDNQIESELIERLSERIRILENELGSLSSVNEQQVELAKRIRSIELSLQQNANNVELNVSKTEPQESKIEGNYIEGRALLADKLIGSAGDDLFDGKGGRDQIDGGEGIDTLLIFENSSSFKVVTLGGVTKVTGLKISAIYGIKETITLINVEFIKFADRTVSLVETSKKDEGQKRKRDIIKFP